MSKLKTLQTALDQLLECHIAIELTYNHFQQDKQDEQNVASELAEASKLLDIHQSRLLFVLLSLVQLSVPGKKG